MLKRCQVATADSTKLIPGKTKTVPATKLPVEQPIAFAYKGK